MEEFHYSKTQFGGMQPHQNGQFNYLQSQPSVMQSHSRTSSNTLQQQSIQMNTRNTHNSSEHELINPKSNTNTMSTVVKQDPLGVYLLQKRSFFWDILLKTYEQQNIIVKTDQEILSIKDKKELPNQRVIKADALRTRPQQFDNDLRDKLEMILTFYCMKKNITYKQGLNEVAGPFVFFLKTNNATIQTVYNYFQIFMDRFIPTLYNDADFHSLQCYFNLFQILMKYHDPELHGYLQENYTTPELYATPWFLTLFANKMSLELIYYFWEIYIVENDRHFVFFISLAVLLYNKESLMKCDPAMLPQKLTQISIETIEDVKMIYQKALFLKSNTPISFGLKLHSMQLFDKQKCCQNPELFFSEMKEYSIEIERVSALPIHPLEILKYQSEDKFHCSNIYCVKNDYLFNGLRQLEPSEQTSYFTLKEQMKTSLYQKECEYCKLEIDSRNEIKGFLKDNLILNELLEIQRDHYKMKRQLQANRSHNYVIIDLRRSKSTGKIYSEFVNGLSTNQKQNEQIAEQLCKQYEADKNTKHFVFLTNDLKATNLIQPEDEQAAPSQSNVFNRFKFPYVGVIEGGFKIVHSLMQVRKLEMLEHNPKICYLCNKQLQPKKLVKSKSKNIFERIADVFAFNDDGEDEKEKEKDKQKETQQNYQNIIAKKEQPQNGLFQIDCRQATATPISNQQLPPGQMPIPQQYFNRQETLSNFIENDNDESQRHIQHSTFQVKHSTPHKSTSTFHTRDSSVLSSSNFQQVSPRPFQSYKQQSQNSSFVNQNPSNIQQISNTKNAPANTNVNKIGILQPQQLQQQPQQQIIQQINNSNGINIHNIQQQHMMNTSNNNISSQSSVKKLMNCTVDSSTQRNSHSSNSNVPQINNVGNRPSVISQNGSNSNNNFVQNITPLQAATSSGGLQQQQQLAPPHQRDNSFTIYDGNNVNNNNINNNLNNKNINGNGTSVPPNTNNQRTPNHYQSSGMSYQYSQGNNLSRRDLSANQKSQKDNNNLSHITDRRDTSLKGKYNNTTSIMQNKSSLSPHSHQGSTTFYQQNNKAIDNNNTQRRNHKSVHQFTSPVSQAAQTNSSQQAQQAAVQNLQQNQQYPQLQVQGNNNTVFSSQNSQQQQQNGFQSTNNMMNNLKEQFNQYQQFQQQQQAPQVQQTQGQQQLLPIQQQNNPQNILINNSQNSCVTVFSQSSQNQATTPLKNQNMLQQTQISQQQLLHGNNPQNKQLNTLSTQALHTGSTVQSPFNAGSMTQQFNGQINFNGNSDGTFTQMINMNNLSTNNSSGISQFSQGNKSSFNNTNPNNAQANINNFSQLSNITNKANNGITSTKSQTNTSMANNNKTPSKNFDYQNGQPEASLTSQGRTGVLSSLTSTPQSRGQLENRSNNNQKKQQFPVGLQNMNSAEYNYEPLNNSQLQSQQQLSTKVGSQKSLSSNMRFANQENNGQSHQSQNNPTNLNSNNIALQSQQSYSSQQPTGGMVRSSNKSFHAPSSSVVPPSSFSQNIPSSSGNQQPYSSLQQNLLYGQQQAQGSGSVTSSQNINNLSQQQKQSVASIQQSVNASIQQAAMNVASLQQQLTQNNFFKSTNNNHNNSNFGSNGNNNSKGVFSSNDFSGLGGNVNPRPSIPLSNNSNNNTPLKRNSQTITNTSITNISNQMNGIPSTNQRFCSNSSQQGNNNQLYNPTPQNSSSQQFTHILMNQQYQNLNSGQSWQKQEQNAPNSNHFSSQQSNSSQSNQNFQNILQTNQNLSNKRQEQIGIKWDEDQKRNAGLKKEEFALGDAFKRYKKSGLFRSCIIPLEQHEAFFEIFERNKFSYYICDRLKESKDDDADTKSGDVDIMKQGAKGIQPKSSKSILIVSTEYVLNLKHSQALETKIQSIKEDQQRILKQLMQGGASNKQEKSLSIGQNLKLNNTSIQHGSTSHSSASYNGEIKIKSFFLMKTLLKITSKKHDKQMHSFYFKLPQILNKGSDLLPEYSTFINKFSFESLYDLIVNKNQSKYLWNVKSLFVFMEKIMQLIVLKCLKTSSKLINKMALVEEFKKNRALALQKQTNKQAKQMVLSLS